jgi:hypothetical protein
VAEAAADSADHADESLSLFSSDGERLHAVLPKSLKGLLPWFIRDIRVNPRQALLDFEEETFRARLQQPVTA